MKHYHWRLAEMWRIWGKFEDLVCDDCLHAVGPKYVRHVIGSTARRCLCYRGNGENWTRIGKACGLFRSRPTPKGGDSNPP